jgi:hypothetical protein
VYKITGALPAAKLAEVMNKGIVTPAGMVNEGPEPSITLASAFNPTPNFQAEIVEPVGALAEPVPKLCIPAKEPVTDCPAVKITPPKFTGIFAIF